MSKWIDFSIDERMAMVYAVTQTKRIDEAAAEKDWWVTAVLYALFHTSVSEYLLFKGGTSLSKGWDIIDRFSEDIDLALNREFFLKVMKLSCANCSSNTQIHNLREKGQDFLLGKFKFELEDKLKEMGLDVTVLGDNEVLNEKGEPTIDACFDADRLDLGRVGITPDPNKMATAKGKELASQL